MDEEKDMVALLLQVLKLKTALKNIEIVIREPVAELSKAVADVTAIIDNVRKELE